MITGAQVKSLGKPRTRYEGKKSKWSLSANVQTSFDILFGRSVLFVSNRPDKFWYPFLEVITLCQQPSRQVVVSFFGEQYQGPQSWKSACIYSSPRRETLQPTIWHSIYLSLGVLGSPRLSHDFALSFTQVRRLDVLHEADCYAPLAVILTSCGTPSLRIFRSLTCFLPAGRYCLSSHFIQGWNSLIALLIVNSIHSLPLPGANPVKKFIY